jgi:predicted dehydrogenase
VLVTAFNYRRRDDVQVLRRVISEGRLGRLYHAKATWLRRSGIPNWGAWFISRDGAGGGPLIDLGVHVLDMSMYLLQEPSVVSVTAASYAELGTQKKGFWDGIPSDSPFEVEDFATAFIRLDNGITLTLEASWAVHGEHNDKFGVTLYGTDGGAQIDVVNYTHEDTLRIFTDIGGKPSESRPLVRKVDGHSLVASEFVQVILSGDWSQHIGREGLRRAQIIEACYQSAAQGREIVLTDAADAI